MSTPGQEPRVRQTRGRAVVLHVLTVKGKGYDAAIDQPERFHGTSPFDRSTGSEIRESGHASQLPGRFWPRARAVCPSRQSRRHHRPRCRPAPVCAISPKSLPKQFFDVGIAEEHAVLFAAGMATKGMHPVCAIYSTFLQRAYDCIVHDVCLQNLPVTFCLDRAGLSPNDGPTHHGLFDIAYLRCVPNAIVMQPRDEDELVDMLHTSLATPTPTFIRYPRGAGTGATIKGQPALLAIGQAEEIRGGTDIIVWALGWHGSGCHRLSDRLLIEEELSVGVINARFAKPLDRELLLASAQNRPLARDDGGSRGLGRLRFSAVLETFRTPASKRPSSVSAGRTICRARQLRGDPSRLLRSFTGRHSTAGLERFKQMHRESVEALS